MANAEANRLEAALQGLVDDGTLSAHQAHRVERVLSGEPAVGQPPTGLGSPAMTGASDPSAAAAPGVPGRTSGSDRSPGHRTLLLEIGGYVGGALLLSGASLVLANYWTDMSRLGRLLVALSACAGLLAIALLTGLRHGSPVAWSSRRRLAATLAALASTAAGGAAAVLRELLLGDRGDSWYWLLIGAGILAVAAPLYLVFRGAPLLFMVWAAGMSMSLELWIVWDDPDASWKLSLVTAGYGVAWLVVAILCPVRERGAAAVLGGLTGLSPALELAADDAVRAGLGVAIGVVLTAGSFVGFARWRRWPFLVPGVLVALSVPAVAFATWFDSVLASGIALVAVGAALLAAGMWALRGIQRRGPDVAESS
jgi:hypothetical protein